MSRRNGVRPTLRQAETLDAMLTAALATDRDSKFIREINAEISARPLHQDWRALLTEQEISAWEWVVKHRNTESNHLVAELVRAELVRARESQTKSEVRQRLMGEARVAQYATAVWELVRQTPPPLWVTVDDAGRVKAHASYPKSTKGLQTLDVRKLHEWQDLTGQITLTSVRACLLGQGRPDPRIK